MKNNINSSFSSRRFKNGAYSGIVTVIVVALIIVLNLLVGKLNIKHDVTSQGLYTLSDQTIEFVKGLDDDIVIYYLASEGAQDDTIWKMMECYADQSSHVSLLLRDPTLYPNFVYNYVEKGTSVYTDSVIIENKNTGKAKFVSSADFKQYQTDQQSYQSYLAGYDVEGSVTSAMQYVVSTETPKVYILLGHNETTLGSSTYDYIDKLNIEPATVNLVQENAIPDDASALMIVGPQSDLTDDETKLIMDYLANGGNVIAYVDYSENKLPNFYSILSYYGVEVADGIVLEQDSKHMYQNVPMYVVPDVLTTDVTGTSAGKYVVCVEPKGLYIDSDIRGSVTRTGFLATSDDAFSKVDIKEGTYTMMNGDVAGPFYLGVLATERYNDVESKLMVFGGSNAVMEQVMSYSSYGNSALFTDALNCMVDRKEAVISIPSKSLEQQQLVIPSSEANRLAIIIVIVLPLAFLACGAVICIKRRKK